MKCLLKRGNIKDARPINNYEGKFNKFLESRKRTLKNKTSRKRLTRMMILMNMPNIWDDNKLSSDFEDSFFDDLSYRFGLFGGNKGRIIRSIVEGIEGYGDINEALIQNEWVMYKMGRFRATGTVLSDE
jgi:hypothetical protein